jgi:hypothetical protein
MSESKLSARAIVLTTLAIGLSAVRELFRERALTEQLAEIDKTRSILAGRLERSRAIHERLWPNLIQMAEILAHRAIHSDEPVLEGRLIGELLNSLVEEQLRGILRLLDEAQRAAALEIYSAYRAKWEGERAREREEEAEDAGATPEPS